MIALVKIESAVRKFPQPDPQPIRAYVAVPLVIQGNTKVKVSLTGRSAIIVALNRPCQMINARLVLQPS
jgi:hypothetical protein